jgi:hypothetical protein
MLAGNVLWLAAMRTTPATTAAVVDLHTEIFGEAVREPSAWYRTC